MTEGLRAAAVSSIPAIVAPSLAQLYGAPRRGLDRASVGSAGNCYDNALAVEPVRPLEGRQLDGLEVPQGPTTMNDLALQRPLIVSSCWDVSFRTARVLARVLGRVLVRPQHFRAFRAILGEFQVSLRTEKREKLAVNRRFPPVGMGYPLGRTLRLAYKSDCSMGRGLTVVVAIGCPWRVTARRTNALPDASRARGYSAATARLGYMSGAPARRASVSVCSVPEAHHDAWAIASAHARHPRREPRPSQTRDQTVRASRRGSTTSRRLTPTHHQTPVEI